MLHQAGEQLEEQVRSFARRNQQQLGPRRARLVDGLLRERRREEHVVERDRAAAAFALAVPGAEERVGAGVGDDHPAFRIGEQDGIGRGVDDAEKQLALALQLVLAFHQRVGGAQPQKLLAEQVRRPARVGGGARGRDQQQAQPRLALLRERERDDEEVAAPEVGDSALARVLRQRDGVAADQREHQRMVGLVEGEAERVELRRRHAVRGGPLDATRFGVDQDADGAPRAAVLAQPRDGGLRALDRLVADQQHLGEGEPGRCSRRARWLRRAPGLRRERHHGHLLTPRAGAC